MQPDHREGVLYATTPKVNVIALDAATGKLLWRFDPNRDNPVTGKMRSRGVAYWSDGNKDQRIFVAAAAVRLRARCRNRKPNRDFR